MGLKTVAIAGYGKFFSDSNLFLLRDIKPFGPVVNVLKICLELLQISNRFNRCNHSDAPSAIISLIRIGEEHRTQNCSYTQYTCHSVAIT